MTRTNKEAAPCKPTSSSVQTKLQVSPGWTSTNWSGYAIRKTRRNAYRSISAFWTVPRVRLSPTNRFSSVWLGIDGFRNTSLIQTGTEQDVINGKAVYYAWWEILPKAETKIRLPVSANDRMYARIAKIRGNRWLIVLANRTKGWTFRKVATYKGPGSTVEWIMEAPSVNGLIAPLARYATFAFSRCRTNGIKPLLKRANRGTVVQEGRTVSTPSLPNRNRDGFSVAYGASRPPSSK